MVIFLWLILIMETTSAINDTVKIPKVIIICIVSPNVTTRLFPF